MVLAEFTAQHRRAIFESLSEGRSPAEGQVDQELLRAALDRGRPQMGPVVYHPYRIVFDFIYPSPHAATLLLPVTLVSPEPIVYMPVPEWVVEQVWQGEVLGSYRFESEARELLATFEESLKTGPFGPQNQLKRG